jgi:hypothetical protein
MKDMGFSWFDADDGRHGYMLRDVKAARILFL